MLESRVYTTDSWLWYENNITRSGALNLINRLTRAGYLIKNDDKSLELTQRSVDLFKRQQILVAPVPARIIVRGQVKAGAAKPEDLIVYIEDGEDAVIVDISIPPEQTQNQVFALEVVGTSMEKEGIYQGDYVIVEEIRENTRHKPEELLVTYYVPITKNNPIQLDLHDDDEIEEGPTLKYIREIQTEASRYYRLSWRRQADENPYAIYAKSIRPIGRVIGVYRSLLE